MRCNKEAVSGYTLCTNHGGPVPSRNFYGSGNMENGSRSRFPIVRLAARYNKMMTNGQVMSNRASIDVIDRRITQLLERVDVEEAPERVAKLYELWKQFSEAQADGKTMEEMSIKKKLDAEFEKIYHDYAGWKQIFEAMDLRGKQVEREVKVLKEIKAIMTAEDAYEMVSKLLAAVLRVVGDEPKRMKQVQYEFTRIIGESGSDVIEGHGEDAGGERETDGGEEGFGDVDQEEFLHPGDEE